jgi:transcription antitermination protein NusB
MPAKKHHRSRRLALQGLCGIDAQGPGGMESVLQFIHESHEDADTLDEAVAMFRQALELRDPADKLLESLSLRWDLARMPVVDRNILRLGVAELMSGTPPKVAIDEGVKLAEEFGGADSPRFVNGVLDAAARKLLPEMGERQQQGERETS